MLDIRTKGAVVILLSIVKQEDFTHASLEAIEDKLTVGEIKTLKSLTLLVDDLDEDETILFYLKLSSEILNTVNSDLDKTNIQGLIDLKIFLVKLFSIGGSLVLIASLAYHLITGKHFELDWVHKVMLILQDMFFG